jgi:hypothetical protein
MSFDAGAGLTVSGRRRRRDRSTADYPHQHEKSQPDRCRAGLSMLGILPLPYYGVQVAEIIFTLLTFRDACALDGRAAGSAGLSALSALSPIVPDTSTVCPT